MLARIGKSAARLHWRPYTRPLLALAALLALAGLALYQPLRVWLLGERRYDAAAMREWVEEARVFRDTLPEMARHYLQALDHAGDIDPDRDPELLLEAGAIEENLRSLGDPPSKMYPGQLPLFPIIYRMVLTFDRPGKEPYEIAWDSELPRYPTQFQTLFHDFDPHPPDDAVSSSCVQSPPARRASRSPALSLGGPSRSRRIAARRHVDLPGAKTGA